MLSSMWRHFFFLLAFLLSSCTAAAGPTPPTPTRDPARQPAPPAPVPTAGTNARVEVVDGYPRYGMSLGFDAITPIYEPQFAPAAEAQLDGEELVIGVAWGGEAKAYPIYVLRTRELVNDELAGVPVLVSW